MFEKIQAYLASQLDIPADEITRDTTFESLGVDSLDTVEMVMDLEEQLGVDRRRARRFRRKQTRLNRHCHDEVRGKAALLGEIAVPCYPQSATAGRNSRPRVYAVSSDPDKRC